MVFANRPDPNTPMEGETPPMDKHSQRVSSKILPTSNAIRPHSEATSCCPFGGMLRASTRSVLWPQLGPRRIHLLTCQSDCSGSSWGHRSICFSPETLELCPVRGQSLLRRGRRPSGTRQVLSDRISRGKMGMLFSFPSPPALYSLHTVSMHRVHNQCNHLFLFVFVFHSATTLFCLYYITNYLILFPPFPHFPPRDCR